MFDEKRPAEVLLEEHLQDAINQQDFFKKHLLALQATLRETQVKGQVSPQSLQTSHQHLVAISENQQRILDDVIAIQKAFLMRQGSVDESELTTINEQSIGAIRRAHEPMLQLSRDNQAMILKLIQLWKNLCSFLGIQVKKGMRSNMESLEFEIGLDEIRFELDALFWLIRRLKHQRELIEKKLKLLQMILAPGTKVAPEFVEALTLAISTYLKNRKHDVLQTALDRSSETQLAPEAHLDELNLHLQLTPAVETTGQNKNALFNEHHFTKPAAFNPDLDRSAFENEAAYQQKLGLQHLDGTLRATLEAKIGQEATNHFANQIMALHMQVHRLSLEQQDLLHTFGHIEQLKPEPELSPEPRKLEPEFFHEHQNMSRIEQDALTRRTMFYRPKPLR